MKKFLAILLAAVMVLSFAACSGNNEKTVEPTEPMEPTEPEEPVEPEGPVEPEETIVGGWNVPENFYAVVSDEVKAIVDGGNATYNGLPMEPVAVLGTQVVAGRNYMVLCGRDNGKGEKELRVATIYEDLEGNYQMTNEVAFDLGAVPSVIGEAGVETDVPENLAPADTPLATVSAPDDALLGAVAAPGEEAVVSVTAPGESTVTVGEGLLGGWTYYSENNAAELPKDLQAAFDGALEGLLGAKYTPVAYIGSQVVAGLNHAFLCSATPVTENPTTELVVIKVYAALDGTYTVNSIDPVLTFFTR